MFAKILTIALGMCGLLVPTWALAYVPIDPLYADQWYLGTIAAPTAWDRVNGAGVTVAVMDAGVAIDHPDLVANIWRNQAEIADDGIDNDQNGYIDDIHGWNFINNSADPRPVVNDTTTKAALRHGTAVAGFIAAVADNDVGVAGVAWGATIMPLKVLNERGSGLVSTLIEGIQYAVTNGADIINLSLVGYQSDAELEQVINWAHDQGVVVVTAAGNTHEGDQPVNLDETSAYPVCYGDNRTRNIILGVAATDQNNKLAPFSSYGSSCVDIAAPGEGMTGLSLRLVGDGYVPDYTDDWSGTSFATALVSGVAALIKSQYVDWSSDQIISTLRATAQGQDAQESYIGAGLVNASSAVASAPSMEHGRLVKTTDQPAVYYVDTTGVRHLFATESTYWTWYDGTWEQQSVTRISQSELDELPVGRNVTVRPGSAIIRFARDGRGYLVGASHQLSGYTMTLAPQLAALPTLDIPPAFEGDYERVETIGIDDRLPDGTLITTEARDAYYLVWGGRRRLVSATGLVANRLRPDRALVVTLDAYDPGLVLDRIDYRVTLYH